MAARHALIRFAAIWLVIALITSLQVYVAGLTAGATTLAFGNGIA